MFACPISHLNSKSKHPLPPTTPLIHTRPTEYHQYLLSEVLAVSIVGLAKLGVYSQVHALTLQSVDDVGGFLQAKEVN
jgi:hypothetical protein